VNGTSCICEQLQSVLTNVEIIEEVDVRRPDQDEEELRDEMIVEQSSEICRAVSDADAVSLFDELISCSSYSFTSITSRGSALSSRNASS